MKILALETSAKSVSAAVTDGGVVRAYTYQNTGLTHSRTLMPLVDAMLRESEQSLADMDLLAVAAGPGSFTGVRIGTHSETPGLGARAAEEKFYGQFTGKSGTLSVIKTGEAGDSEINAITAATITSTAVTNAVNEALDCAAGLN